MAQIPSRTRAPSRAYMTYIAIVTLLLSAPLLAIDQQVFLGIWYGDLAIPNGPSLRLALEVIERSDGSLAADLISIDQGADGAPSSSVTLNDDIVRVEIRRPNVVVEGRLSDDGQFIDAEYRQGNFKTSLPLRRIDRMPGFALRAQNPVRPYPYDEHEIIFSSNSAVLLSGTLTLPRGEGPHPAVVLVTGSGPQGRDELIGYHRPFLVLADFLTRRGIAVLRYDDRGVGQSTGSYETATTADFANDAMAGVTYLRSRSDIHPDQVGIVGHSEGGMIAPMVAADMPEVGFIVLLAGPGIPIDELIVTQIGLFALEAGASEARVDVLRAMHRTIHQAINTGADRAEIFTVIRAYYNGLSAAERNLLGWSQDMLNAVVESRLTPWWRYFLAFDPAVYLGKVHCPLLALNGDRDLNVTASDNLAAIGRALDRAGNREYQTVELPGLNHMLNAHGEGEPADTTHAIETINRVALDLVSSWIRARAGLTPANTAVEESQINLPQRLALEANYPNPFNGATSIRFHLPREGAVELVVYNLAGQRVATLLRETLVAGTHVVSWDGSDTAGNPAASGLYLYQVRDSDQFVTRCLILVR